MNDLDLDEALTELESAEDFLDYFGIAHEPAVVRVNRLHILQRFHDYLRRDAAPAGDDAARFAHLAALLGRAYRDFVDSDARTEKVFRVFHMHEPQTAFVPLAALAAARPRTLVPATATAGGCGCGSQGVCHSSAAAAGS
jgi:nitrogenase-stabilizing/protective protein